MFPVEDLLTSDLTHASRRVAVELVPDVSAALDRLLPLIAGGDRMAVRRYVGYVDEACRAVTELRAAEPSRLPPSGVVYGLLVQETANFPWVAPTATGEGVLCVLVDRFRGYAAGLVSECVHPPKIDLHLFQWFAKEVRSSVLEREQASPLRRAMTIFDLTTTEFAALMNVKRQAVDKWLLTGPPPDRTPKIAAVSEIADILRYRLREGLPAAVARRAAPAYRNRTMLEVIRDDEHEWLLASVRESFDFRRTA